MKVTSWSGLGASGVSTATGVWYEVKMRRSNVPLHLQASLLEEARAGYARFDGPPEERLARIPPEP
jgi:hypothetical protein